ncbi:hypothetical protein F4819DRAFT_341761 [Hypoxylon fuscum]|nr:hypothetical protein F4819DRAFT_341761 [Hypoxylon fuscum]
MCWNGSPWYGEFSRKLETWHGKNMPGSTTAVHLHPETGLAVTVLHNSLGRCDVEDWICQSTIDTQFLGNPAQNNVHLVSNCVKLGFNCMEEVQSQLRKERVQGAKYQPTHIAVGTSTSSRIGSSTLNNFIWSFRAGPMTTIYYTIIIWIFCLRLAMK